MILRPGLQNLQKMHNFPRLNGFCRAQCTTILLSGLMTLTFSGGHKEDRVVGETGAALAQTTGEAGQSQYHAEIHRVQVSAPHPRAITQQP